MKNKTTVTTIESLPSITTMYSRGGSLTDILKVLTGSTDNSTHKETALAALGYLEDNKTSMSKINNLEIRSLIHEDTDLTDFNDTLVKYKFLGRASKMLYNVEKDITNIINSKGRNVNIAGIDVTISAFWELRTTLEEVLDDNVLQEPSTVKIGDIVGSIGELIILAGEVYHDRLGATKEVIELVDKINTQASRISTLKRAADELLINTPYEKEFSDVMEKLTVVGDVVSDLVNYVTALDSIYLTIVSCCEVIVEANAE